MGSPLLRLALFIAFLCAAGCGPQAGSFGRVDESALAVEIGTGGLVSAGRWNLVRVHARAVEGSFRATLFARGQRSDGSFAAETCTREIEGGPTLQEFQLPLRVTDWVAVEVELRTASGSIRRTVPVAPAPDTATRRVLFVGSADSSLSTVEAMHWGRIPASDFPRAPSGLEAADLIVLAGTALAEAPSEARAALIEWVAGGGRVVAEIGPEWSGGQTPQEILELFGLARSPEPVDECSEFWRLAPVVAAFAPEEAQLAELVVDASLERGRATAIAWSPPPRWLDEELGAEVWKTPPAVKAAWKRVLADLAVPRPPIVPREVFEAAAIRWLGTQGSLRFPSRREVGMLLASYLVLGFAAIGFLCRWRRRPGLAYLISVILALALCVGIWRYGLIFAFRERTIDAVTLALPREGNAVASAARVVAVTSPTRAELSLAEILPGLRGARPKSIEAAAYRSPSLRVLLENPAELERQPMEITAARQALEVTGLPLDPNAMRFLAFDDEVALGGRVEALWRKDLALRNRTRSAVSFYFIHGRGIERLGPCESGSELMLPRDRVEDPLPARQSEASPEAVEGDSDSGFLDELLAASPSWSGFVIAARLDDAFLGEVRGARLRHGETWVLIPVPPRPGRF